MLRRSKRDGLRDAPAGAPRAPSARGEASSGARETLDGCQELADLLVRLVAAASHRIADAVVRMVGEEPERYPVQRLVDGGDLGQKIDAVRLILDHPSQPAHLSLDPREPAKHRWLVVHVAGCGGPLGHDRSIYREGVCPLGALDEVAERALAAARQGAAVREQKAVEVAVEQRAKRRAKPLLDGFRVVAEQAV